MKKVSLRSLLLIIPGILLSLFSVTIVAAAVPEAGDGWAELWQCTGDSFLVTEAKDRGLLMIPYDNDYDTLAKDNPDKCIIENMIGAIHDYNQSAGDEIVICAPGTKVGRRNNSPADLTKYRRGVYTASQYKSMGTNGLLMGDGKVCCPLDHPISYDHDPKGAYDWVHTRCCEESDGVEGTQDCFEGGTGESPTWYDIIHIDDSQYFKDAEPVYTCPQENCLMENASTPYPAGEKRSNLLGAEIGPYAIPKSKYCFPNKDNAAISGSNPPMYCISGTVMDQADYDEWKNKLTVYLACKDFKDAAESEACLECVKGGASYVYSSLGCINTEKNALIIRIMQIGIGIVGAIGILRIMQAAMLRQTADPAKIQESWDIISSVIIGLIILLGSVVILRIIGINVLGILPLDF